jgi:hypothetical protein
MAYGKTAHNKSVYASPLDGLGHPHLADGLCFAKPLFGLQKRRKQPKRYVKYQPKIFWEILNL